MDNFTALTSAAVEFRDIFEPIISLFSIEHNTKCNSHESASALHVLPEDYQP